MPLPAIGGLIVAIDVAVTAVYRWFQFFGARKAVIMGYFTAATIAGWVALALIAKAFVAGMNFILPSFMGPPLRFIASIMPANFFPCMAFLIALAFAKWAWERKEQWMQVAAQAN